LLRMPESNIPFGVFGRPDVTLWLLATHIQLTISPVRMTTPLGLKLVPPCPTFTFVVAAGARTGSKIRNSSASRKFTLKVLAAERIWAGD
jgi:hypothetical protein